MEVAVDWETYVHINCHLEAVQEVNEWLVSSERLARRLSASLHISNSPRYPLYSRDGSSPPDRLQPSFTHVNEIFDVSCVGMSPHIQLTRISTLEMVHLHRIVSSPVSFVTSNIFNVKSSDRLAHRLLACLHISNSPGSSPSRWLISTGCLQPRFTHANEIFDVRSSGKLRELSVPTPQHLQLSRISTLEMDHLHWIVSSPALLIPMR